MDEAASDLRHAGRVIVVTSSGSAVLLVFVGEDGFDGAVEEASEFEGERETGIELAGLDGVDRLPRDFEALGEIGLAPVAFGAEDAEAIFHWYLKRMSG